MMWTLVFLIAIIPVAIIHSDNRDILILAFLAFLLMSSSLPAAISCYRKIGAEPQVSRDSRTMLTTYYKQMVRVLRLEKVWSQFSIPAYLVIGLVYSQILRYGSFGEIHPEPRTIIVAAVLMVIAVPLVILWVGWSQKVAYQEDLAELKAEIEGLGE